MHLMYSPRTSRCPLARAALPTAVIPSAARDLSSCSAGFHASDSSLGGRSFSSPRASRGSDIKTPPLPHSCAGRCTRHKGSFFSRDTRHGSRPFPHAGHCNRHDDSSSHAQLITDHCKPSSFSPLVYPERSRRATRHYLLTPFFSPHRQPHPAISLFSKASAHQGGGDPRLRLTNYPMTIPIPSAHRECGTPDRMRLQPRRTPTTAPIGVSSAE